MAASGFPLPPRYEQPELIAHGGMGDVFRATDAALERTVAVKVLAERYARNDEFRARFVREAQTAARLSGEPHVVTIFDVGEEDGLPYIVMEYLPGGSVADRRRAGTIAAAQALDWLEQAGAALDAAHARGIVHRDVKPANLLLAEDGEVRVTDFGIARASGQDTLTITGTILGTSGYMSPEQARGQRATAASDRYALGCMAFELLTGRRPFEGDTVAVEAAAHATAPIPAATGVDPSLPAALDGVFTRALAKEPSERYESCGDLVADLRNAFHEAATETRRLQPAPVPVPVPPRTPRTSLHRARRLSPGWALGAGAAVLLAGFGIGWLAVRDEGGQRANTVVLTQTETIQGEPQVTTVTVEEPTTSAPPAADAAALNDQGFALMQQGDYEAALPLLEQAVSQLAGTGELVEAYASYNLAFTRFALGRCDDVLALLDRSEAVQGERKEIDRLRREAERHCDGSGSGED